MLWLLLLLLCESIKTIVCRYISFTVMYGREQGNSNAKIYVFMLFLSREPLIQSQPTVFINVYNTHINQIYHFGIFHIIKVLIFFPIIFYMAENIYSLSILNRNKLNIVFCNHTRTFANHGNREMKQTNRKKKKLK